MENKRLGVFIFRRDLRLYDNLGLINLAKISDIIIPVFILDENQIVKNNKNKHYFSNNAVQFMCESLVDLNSDLMQYNSSLKLFIGLPHIVIETLIKTLIEILNNDNITIGFNQDYSKYSLERDDKILKVCKNNNVDILVTGKTHSDYTLLPFENMLRENGSPYKQFSAFYKNAVKYEVNNPIKNTFNNYYSGKINGEYNDDLTKFYQFNNQLSQRGGRKNGLKQLHDVNKLKYYAESKDNLDYKTSELSAFLNFGCISIRETYHTVKKFNNAYIRQLYWRDYYIQFLIFEKNGNEFKHIDDRYNRLKWKNNVKDWETLINAQTGFLLIDASMNHLKITGYIHNRSRLLLATFWTKYLLIDIFHPIYGSQVEFSKYLVDAVGPSQNKMNHQWITELDFAGRRYAPKNIPLAGRPMDISNKMVKKFDPELTFIKTWLPHLKDVPHNTLMKYCIGGDVDIPHPRPIFDPKEKYKEWINICKNKP